MESDATLGWRKEYARRRLRLDFEPLGDCPELDGQASNRNVQ